MADIKGLLSDPQFNSLDPQTQKQVLGRIDPTFSNLSDSDLSSFKQKMGVAPAPQQAQTPAPSFGQELYQQNIAPILGLASSLASKGPIQTAKDIGGQIWDNTKNEAVNGVWAALTGQGDFANSGVGERISNTIGHAIGAIPVAGPALLHTSENIMTKGHEGAAAADLLSLGLQVNAPEAAAGVAGQARNLLGWVAEKQPGLFRSAASNALGVGVGELFGHGPFTQFVTYRVVDKLADAALKNPAVANSLSKAFQSSPQIARVFGQLGRAGTVAGQSLTSNDQSSNRVDRPNQF